MESKCSHILSALVLGGAIGLGFFGSGFLIAKALYHAKAADRYVTVKGLAEQAVKADLGVWEIDFREIGNNLTDVSARVDRDRDQVVQFLIKQGFNANEIGQRPLKVVDQLANIYGTPNATAVQNRYVLTGGIRVQSAQVDLIQKVNQMISSLVTQGIALTFESPDLNPNPSYFYTGLDTIRPNMLAKATQSARLVAKQFAENSGSHLGGIRRANQGIFQVFSKDGDNSENNWQSTQNQLGAIYKKVRLVTTIDYLLLK